MEGWDRAGTSPVKTGRVTVDTSFVRTRRVFRWTLALCAACGFGTLGSPVGSSLTVVREVIDDARAGDCTGLGDLSGDQRPDVLNGAGLAGQPVPLRTYDGATPAQRLLAEPPAGYAFVGACPLGDLDGDGDLDVAITVAGVRPSGLVGTPAEVSWLENPAPAADPWTAHTIGVHDGGVPLDLVIADLDGDGRADVASRSDRTLQVWWSNDAGWSAEPIAVPGGRGLVAGDVDGDGIAELVAGGTLLARGATGSWTASTINGAASATAAIADFDGDQRTDIALGPFDATGPIAVHRHTDEGWLAVAVTTDTGGAVHRLEAADLDYDADIDLVTAALRGPVTILTNEGRARLWTPRVIDPDGLFDFAVGDVDLDGDRDIVGSNPAGSAPLVLFRNRASEPVVLGGELPRVSVTGGPTPAPSTTAAPPTTAPAAGDAGTASPGGGPETSAAGAVDPATATADTAGDLNEVALGLPTTATAPPRSTTSTGATAGTEPAAPIVDATGDAVPLGPPSVDPEVAVLPEVLERRIVPGPEGRSPWVVAAAFALAALGAVLCWPLLLGRSPVPAWARRHGGHDGDGLSRGERAAGGPAGKPDPGGPTGSDPAS
ncbi:MAG: FG-GAP-like repeat-containing protein [Acidimicrobiia bacterium]